MTGLPRGTGPPRYPLSVHAFREALRRGLGRAWVQVHEHGADGLRDVIREVATYCRVLDPQVEGKRAEWVATICERAGVVDELVERFADGVADDEVNWAESRHREQRAELLRIFAAGGRAAARDALYRLVRFDAYSGRFIGLDEILELDGSEGLLFAARTIGEHAERNPSYWTDGDLMDAHDRRHGEGSGRAYLDRHAPGDPHVAAYLAAADETRERWSRESAERRRQTVDEVIAAIRASTRRLLWLRMWRRDATEAELATIIDLLREEDLSPSAMTNTLVVLHGGAGPHLTDELRTTLERRLLRHLESDDAEIRWRAAIALGRFSSDNVRAQGLVWLERDVVIGLRLLERSARADDAHAVAEALDAYSNSDEDLVHDVGSALVNVLTHSELRSVDLALRVYEHTPCAWCRKQTVEALLAWDAAPTWLVAEARHDGAANVRALVACA